MSESANSLWVCFPCHMFPSNGREWDCDSEQWFSQCAMFFEFTVSFLMWLWSWGWVPMMFCFWLIFQWFIQVKASINMTCMFSHRFQDKGCEDWGQWTQLVVLRRLRSSSLSSFHIIFWGVMYLHTVPYIQLKSKSQTTCDMPISHIILVMILILSPVAVTNHWFGSTLDKQMGNKRPFGAIQTHPWHKTTQT